MEDKRINLVPLLAKLSGRTEEEMLATWAGIKAQSERTAACQLHELDLVELTPFPKYRCRRCMWVPQPGELARYEQGLAHGRANATGGGASK